MWIDTIDMGIYALIRKYYSPLFLFKFHSNDSNSLGDGQLRSYVIAWWQSGIWLPCLNSLRPRRNGRYNADDIFKCIFLKEIVWIPTIISMKFVPKGPINNIPAMVQIMAWRRPGDKPLSEPMMVSLLTHICVTRPQWVNRYWSVTPYFHWSTVVVCQSFRIFPGIWKMLLVASQRAIIPSQLCVSTPSI